MDPVSYVCQNENDDVAKIFVEKLEKVAKKIYETFKEPKPMIFDEKAKKLHESQKECYACGGGFCSGGLEYRKVRDHCHYIGKYRGTLHSKCNLRLKTTRTIPVFFHNLTGYDSHLFVKRLTDSHGDVNCIPRNEEKYIIFNKQVLVDTVVRNDKKVNVYSTLKFADTMNFMQTSLEKLVDNIEKQDFKREISDKDYFHAQEVFKTFDCKNLADYTKLYCKSDVLLLADVFETFIDVCLKKYGLDPSHYITAPSLSMDAMLKLTGIELELLTDPDMHLFFEKGIRGGFSTVTGRYAKANNKYMEDYVSFETRT